MLLRKVFNALNSLSMCIFGSHSSNLRLTSHVSFVIVSELTFKSRGCYRVFCHGITKWGACTVVIYNYILCWLYSMTKSVVIALILFLVFFMGFYCIGFSIKLVKTQA